MTIQGYREIVGEDRFFGFARELLHRYAHGNVSASDFIPFAEEESGLAGDELALLDDYFQQWLYGIERPTIVPEDFGP
ncbi:MAG TPA: hypothetical protein VK326_04700 [Solirubrobacterales bacterium]|nr:hypothetical protein [Solirubrobacterales bacterium]